MVIELIVQVLLVAVLLTILGGASQALPWGSGSAQQLRQQSMRRSREFGTKADQVVDVAANPIVTAEFDIVTRNRVSTLSTDNSFSWIVSKPIEYYKPARYLVLEFVTQVLVAVGIVGVNFLLADSSQSTRVSVVLLAAALTAVAAYGPLLNWWGLTSRYVVGVSLTTVVSWGLSIWLITTIWP